MQPRIKCINIILSNFSTFAILDQPKPRKAEKSRPNSTQPNQTHWSTQPMDNSGEAHAKCHVARGPGPAPCNPPMFDEIITQTTPFSAFCTAVHSVVTGKPRNFKFGTLTYHSKSHTVDKKSSLKGAWSGSGDLF